MALRFPGAGVARKKRVEKLPLSGVEAGDASVLLGERLDFPQ